MLDKLNPEQKAAIEYIDGPLLIIAGAGTGKTTVVTRKIVNLIEKGLAKPEQILAMTFTDKAAGEMEERVDKLLPQGYLDLQISTFHSFCQRLLEHYGIEIGLSNNFKLINQTDAWMLVRENLDKFNLDYYRPLGNPAQHIHELIRHFSKCKDELIGPSDYLSLAESRQLDSGEMNIEEKNRLTEVANAFHTYNQILLDNSALDFGDLIFFSLKLLKDRPLVLRALQQRFKYILIDEFQDVNWAQYQLTQMLAGSESQLTAVGDDDQSIFAFRGASVSNILRFKQDYPKAKEVVLTQNYRSGQKILDVAHKLIKNNDPDRLEAKLKINKQLKSDKTGFEGKIEHLHLNTLEDEALSVVRKIQEIKKAEPECTWDDFAVLVRANNHAEPFIAAFESAGIPYEFLAASGLYRQPIVLDCFSYLQAVDSYHESTAIFRLLKLPFLKFPESDLQKLTYFARRKALSLFQTMKQAQEFHLSDIGIKICDKLIRLVSSGMQMARQSSPTGILTVFLNDSGYLEYLAKAEKENNWQIVRQIFQLQQWFKYVKRYEQVIQGANVNGFVSHFQQVVNSGDEGALYQPIDTPDSVNILTIHKAKGLEFKWVFIVNLVEERFPSRRRGEPIPIPEELIKEQLPEGDFHLQEERRLFYVAVTRAKQGLFLVSSENYGGLRKKKTSRFIKEMGISSQDMPAHKNEETLASFLTARPVKDEKKTVSIPVPDCFSFSQISTYQKCPYQYDLAYRLLIPIKGKPHFSFGQSLHSTLYRFYQKLTALNEVQQRSLFDAPIQAREDIAESKIKVPDLDELLEIYTSRWIDDWYENAVQKKEYFQKGKDILKAFYKAQENHWTVPVCLESKFKVKINKYLVAGRIDRIDKMADNSLEIIDYKTGKGKDKVSGDDKNQLLMYQLAVQSLPEYINQGKTGQLTFYYLEPGNRVSFLGNAIELGQLQEKIVKIIDDIVNEKFEPTPSRQVCPFCDFQNICEYRQKD